MVVENIELCGYDYPTPIQAYTIPAVLKGHDMIGVAQTGWWLHDTRKELADRLDRIWQDRSLSHPMHLQVDGEGQEACSSSSEPGRRI